MRILITIILLSIAAVSFAQGNAVKDSTKREIDSNYVVVDLRDFNKLFEFMGDPINFPDGSQRTFSANDRERFFLLLTQYILEPANKRKRPIYKQIK